MSLALALALLAAPAQAGNFMVSQTTLQLGPVHHSGLVGLRNSGVAPIRFEVTAYAWDESENGEMLLVPTTDLLVFPTLFTIAPGEDRQIRVGATPDAGATELTWRVFVEELPALSADGSVGVELRTRLGIPVFLAPDEPRVGGHIADASVNHGRLSLRVVNDGNVHFRVQDVTVAARRADGTSVFSETTRGWYVLAGGAREFGFDLPAECDEIAALDLRVQTDVGTWTSEVPAVASGCVE